MERILLGLICGMTSALWWPLEVFDYAVWGLLGGLVICTRFQWVAGVCLGIGWAALFFHWQLGWLDRVLPNSQGVVTVSGQVVSVVIRPDHQKINLDVTTGLSVPWGVTPRIQLTQTLPKNALSSQLFQRGDQITVTATLKLAHGLANPVGFAAERWFLGQGIAATGKITELHKKVSSGPGWRDAWLMKAREQMRHFQETELLMALVFGEQQDVDKNDWQLLRNTGLIHLIAISGMHIGVIAWLGIAVSRLCLRRRVENLHWHLLIGFLLAVLYCALADFSPPTIRALWMLGLWFGIRAWQRRWSSLRVWICALACMLVLQPWSIFSAGLWLSFIAVGGLGIAGFFWRKPSLWQIQWLMTILLIPFQLFMFDGLSLTSLIINMIAGPWFTFSIVPIALVAGLMVPVLPWLSHWGFWWCDWQLHLLMRALAWLEAWQTGWFSLSETQSCVVLWGLAGVIFVGLFRWAILRMSCWWLALTGLCLVLVQPKPSWRVDMLDIGQGLSVLVTQGDRALLFDTGDAFPGGANMADAVIFPMLIYRGIHALDYLVISHKDKDHAANWAKIHTRYPNAQILSSGNLTPDTLKCQRGQHFQWGQLMLTVLSPTGITTGDHNEDSCVLRISDGFTHVLLTGDVEGRAEQALTVLPAADIRSQIMSSPHHGSHTSSSEAFIRQVSPEFVVHSAGFKNRWQHPHADIVARYQAMGVTQYNTARVGLVTFAMNDRKNIEILPFRRHQPWYWQLDTWLVGHQQLE
jgi:competence protein ComEC